MFTTLDKALVAVLIPLLLWANQKWGLTLPVDADTWLPIVAALGGLLVYAVPNKAGAPRLDDKGSVPVAAALALGAVALLALWPFHLLPVLSFGPLLILGMLCAVAGLVFLGIRRGGLRSAVAFSAMGLVGVLLCGCASVQTKVDDTLSNQDVQTGIQLACATFTGISAGWDVYAANHHVSDDAMTAVAGAKAAVGTICTPPYPTDTASLIATVTHAGVAVMSALQEAQHAETAAAE
jgi:hypothetical protein